MNLKINEIFFSIQGEAGTSGLPTIFIRTTGCNLRCLYCDTGYAWEEGEELSLSRIISRISAYPCKRICITGGEPLCQREGVIAIAEKLQEMKYSITMETNGSWPVTDLPENLKAVIDVKTPGSGMSGVNNYENMRSARRHHDEFKFVIAREEDFPWALEVIERYKLDRRFLCHVSPVPEIPGAWLAEKILESGRDLRLNLQLHKLLWPETGKGK